MRVDKIAFVGIILTFIFISWSLYSYFNPNFEKIFNENNLDFQSKKEDFNIAIKKIERHYIINHKNNKEINVYVNNLPIDLKNQLSELGINEVIITFDNLKKCSKNYKISLVVTEGWNIKTLNQVIIIYSPCDNNTLKNHHSYDGRHIDTWGQGENWLIYSDTDFI